MSNLAELSLTEANTAFARGEATAEALLRACLGRIDAHDMKVNSVIRLDREAALEAALAQDRARSAGIRTGPLGGVPMLHKDMSYRAGRVSTFGSKIRREFVPGVTATVLQRLDAAGATDAGTLNMAEFAQNPTGHNAHFGDACNPWHGAYVTGGSSSGSGAAVAARFCYAALGSDTGGSIRRLPAAFCGVTGLKPTTCAAGGSRWWRTGSSTGPTRRWWPRSTRRWTRCANGTGRSPGCKPLPCRRSWPTPRWSAGWRATPSTRNGCASGRATTRRISPPGCMAAMPSPGRSTSRRCRGAVRCCGNFVAEALTGHDLVATPTLRLQVPTRAETDVDADPANWSRFMALSANTRPFNYRGLPTISIPCGVDDRGLPIGLQLAGRPFAEATVLRAADAFQRATDWQRRMPPLD